MNTEELQKAYVPLVNKESFFRRLARRIHLNSVRKGFYDEPVLLDKVVAKLALIHSEVTEVLEALRKSQGKVAVTDEVADIIIRTLDLHDWMVELDLATDDLDLTMERKMEKNENRPAKHGHVWG